MKTNSIIVFVFIFLIIISYPIYSQTNNNGINLILIVDVSQTMIGKAGGSNIFSRVKETCKEFVNDLKKDDTVTLIKFSTDVEVYPTITLLSDADKIYFYNMINDLKATGKKTFIAKALKVSYEEAARLEQIHPNFKNIVVILTDGINDPPESAIGIGPRLEEAARPFKGKPWFVYQVNYGENKGGQLKNIVESMPKGKYLSNPTPDEREKIVRKSQENVFEAKFSKNSLHISLDKVNERGSDYLIISLSPNSSADDISINIDRKNIPSSVSLDSRLEQIEAGNFKLILMAKAIEKIENGEYNGDVELKFYNKPAELKKVNFYVTTKLISPMWPKLLLIGVVIIVMLIAVLKLISSRKILFGKLEIYESGLVKSIDDLSEFGGHASIGGRKTDIELEGAKGKIAGLSVETIEGENRVIVKSSANKSIICNDSECSKLILEDGIEFKIDKWEFHYFS